MRNRYTYAFNPKMYGSRCRQRTRIVVMRFIDRVYYIESPRKSCAFFGIETYASMLCICIYSFAIIPVDFIYTSELDCTSLENVAAAAANIYFVIYKRHSKVRRVVYFSLIHAACVYSAYVRPTNFIQKYIYPSVGYALHVCVAAIFLPFCCWMTDIMVERSIDKTHTYGLLS